MIRGTVALVGGARLAASAGSLLQFVFVSALLCIFLVPAAFGKAQPLFLGSAAAEWIPTNWFLGLFERLRGSPRPDFFMLSERALIATPLVVASAVIVTVAGFWRQMQLALVPSARVGPLGGARVGRALARLMGGRRPIANATSDFILLTIVRNRAQQAPIALNAAVGVAVVALALSQHADGLASLTRPRTAVLWIPLVLAYWTTIGLRASFFVPCELPSAWSFHANAPERVTAYWSAVRASMAAFVMPPALVLTLALVVPLVGWSIALWHAVIVCAMTVLLVEAVSMTIDHIPFTRAYEPGHAKLKTRWPIYLLGMFASAYWPTQLELRLLGRPKALLIMLGCIAAAIIALEVVARRRALRWSVQVSDQAGDDLSSLTVLDIGRVVQGSSGSAV